MKLTKEYQLHCFVTQIKVVIILLKFCYVIY